MEYTFRESGDINISELGTNYSEIAAVMTSYVNIIRDKTLPVNKRRNCAKHLRNCLRHCATIKDLDDLTVIYRDKVNNDNLIGYDAVAAVRFVMSMSNEYPKPEGILDRYLTHRNHIYAEIGAIMADCIHTIRTVHDDPDGKEPKVAAKLLRICLDDCLDRPGLNDLTEIYRNTYEDNIICYNATAVSDFVKKLTAKYPLEEGAFNC